MTSKGNLTCSPYTNSNRERTILFATVELIEKLNMTQQFTPFCFRQGLLSQQTSKSLFQLSVFSLSLTISLRMVGATKDGTRSKGVPKFSPELYSKTWVSIMDHIVWQAKLSDNTLEKQLYNLFSAQLPRP